MKANPLHAGIPTIDSLRRERRRIDRHRRAFYRALAAMRGGQALYLHYAPQGECWSLSNGQHVAPEVATLLINHPQVTGVGDALFSGTRCQTYRYSQGENDD